MLLTRLGAIFGAAVNLWPPTVILKLVGKTMSVRNSFIAAIRTVGLAISVNVAGAELMS